MKFTFNHVIATTKKVIICTKWVKISINLSKNLELVRMPTIKIKQNKINSYIFKSLAF